MIDLFAGTCAFSYVCNKNNIKCVFANDISNDSKNIFDINHDIELTCKDLNSIELKNIPKHNILCGGFPCQPFSIAGMQKAHHEFNCQKIAKHMLDLIETGTYNAPWKQIL